MEEATYPADTQFIAPFNTLSSEQDWRDKLQKMDEVDFMIKDREWQTGTICWMDTRQPGTKECSMPMVRVGFRIYSPDGDK